MDATQSKGQSGAGGASGYLTIDLAALARNYERLAEQVAPARVAPSSRRTPTGSAPPGSPRNSMPMVAVISSSLSLLKPCACVRSSPLTPPSSS